MTPSICTTGASVQQPRQATFSIVNSPRRRCRRRGDLQPPLESVLDQFGPFHVTGRAVADVNDVPADRAMAELAVERRHAHDRRRRDLRQLADALDRLARHVAIVRLNRLQDRNHGILAAAEPLDALIDESEIKFRHFLCIAKRRRLFSDAKHVFVLPREIDSPVLKCGLVDALLAQIGLADPLALLRGRARRPTPCRSSR